MRVLIIAEAGVNHNGSLDLAKRLVDAASEAGADIVKFQTFKADKIVSPIAKKAHYQSENTFISNIRLIIITINKGNNMNIKKIGLTALAGSLVATSAYAGALTLNGGAKLSYTTYSGSIATKDLEEYSIYQGNPAVKIRKRNIVE